MKRTNILVSSKYSSNNGMQFESARIFFEKYAHLVRGRPNGEDVVLDVGSGTGEVTMEIVLPRLPKQFQKLIGCDVSRDMAESAASRIKHEKVEFVVLDIEKENLNWQSGCFDRVYSTYCIHWLKDYTQALLNINKLLKPGGFTMLLVGARFPIYMAYDKMGASQKWSPYMEGYKDFIIRYQYHKNPAQDFRKLLEATNFQVHLCVLDQINYDYPSMKFFRDAMDTINPFTDGIPAELLEDYWIDYFKKWRTCEKFNKNNELHFYGDIVIAVASKI